MRRQTKRTIKPQTYFSLIIMIIVNLYPLWGLMFSNWDKVLVLYFYLIETFVIGVFTIIKMILCNELYDPYFASLNPIWLKKYKTKSRLLFACIPPILIFIVLTFLAVFAIKTSGFHDKINFPINQLGYFTLIITSSHLISFFLNFVMGQEYKTTPITRLFSSIFTQRIMPLFFSIFLLLILMPMNSGESIILFVMILKIVFDVLTHINEHLFYSKK